MRATPRPNPRSIGARLAEKFPSKYRRRRATSGDVSRPRPKRPRVSLKSEPNSRSRSAKLDAEARRVIRDVEVAYTERQIAQSHTGRELLRLTDLRSTALFREQFAALAVTIAHEAAESARAEHQHVCSQGLHQQFDSAHRALWEAEALEGKAVRLHGEAVTARELVDAELSLLARAAR